MVKGAIEQGAILKIEGIKSPILVISKSYYNRTTGQIIGCPVVNKDIENAIYKKINTSSISGTVLCDNLRNFDLLTRGYSLLDSVSFSDMMIICDIVQGLIDYL